MKQIQIENGVIRYYGNRVGRVTEGCAVVDPMFQNEALESFLRKQRNIQKIQWQDGIYDRLANSQQDMESAKGLKDVRIWQLRGDVDVHMKFLALFQMEQQYGSPKPDFYIKVYEGASDTNDLEELYDKFRYHPPSGYTGHGLSISDVLELYDETAETALPLVEQRRTVEHAGDGLDGLEIGAPVVQPPDDARVDLRSAERHDYGHPLAKRHAFRHRKGVERLGQRKYDVGIAHGRSRIEKECFQAAEPTGPSGAEPQPQNDGINSVFLRVKLRIIPGKQILPAGSTRSIISNRRRFPNSSSYR